MIARYPDLPVHHHHPLQVRLAHFSARGWILQSSAVSAVLVNRPGGTRGLLVLCETRKDDALTDLPGLAFMVVRHRSWIYCNPISGDAVNEAVQALEDKTAWAARTACTFSLRWNRCPMTYLRAFSGRSDQEVSRGPLVNEYCSRQQTVSKN